MQIHYGTYRLDQSTANLQKYQMLVQDSVLL
nr:MAG TPA: hypothetical protein [Caudoviricetes sp.]